MSMTDTVTELSAEQGIATTIEDRLDRLEAQQREKRSIVARLGVWGGLLALVISISTGVFTIRDELFIKPTEQTEARMQQFERSIREIGALYQDTSSRISTTSDPSIRRSIEMQANGQLLILVRDAESIEPFIRKEITAPDYVVLGNTELQLLHYQDAIKYLRLASERETDTSTHAEILRFLGQAYAMLNTPGGLKKARMAFRQSEALMESFTGYNVAFQRANLIASEIYVEAYFGDCSRLPDLTKRLLGEIDAPGVSLESMRALRLTLARSLEGQSRCQWDRAAIVPAP